MGSKITPRIGQPIRYAAKGILQVITWNGTSKGERRSMRVLAWLLQLFEKQHVSQWDYLMDSAKCAEPH